MLYDFFFNENNNLHALFLLHFICLFIGLKIQTVIDKGKISII